MDSPDLNEIRRAVLAALAEDIGSGDVTTLATVPESAKARAVMRAREPLVVAGLDFAEAAFHELSPVVQIERLAKDGRRVNADEILLKISGPTRAILSAERKFSTRAKPRPAGGALKNTPSCAAVAAITAPACLTWCSSRTTISRL